MYLSIYLSIYLPVYPSINCRPYPRPVHPLRNAQRTHQAAKHSDRWTRRETRARQTHTHTTTLTNERKEQPHQISPSLPSPSRLSHSVTLPERRRHHHRRRHRHRSMNSTAQRSAPENARPPEHPSSHRPSLPPSLRISPRPPLHPNKQWYVRLRPRTLSHALPLFQYESSTKSRTVIKEEAVHDSAEKSPRASNPAREALSTRSQQTSTTESITPLPYPHQAQDTATNTT